MKNLFNLKDRDIWVVGGAGYLGRAIVADLHSAGARLLCIDLENRARDYVSAMAFGDAVEPAALDIRDVDAMKRFVTARTAERGVPDGLVNLTFLSTSKALIDLTENEFDAVNHAGLTATFALCREIGTSMAKAGRGSIVLFSSMYGIVSPDPRIYEAPMNPNPVEYGVGKAGIRQMTRYLAVHWGRAGVRVNCISPGPFPNPDVQRVNRSFVERLEDRVPMGRVGQSDEIAGAVHFLLSDASSYVTGHDLNVDGGWTVW